MIFFRTRNHRRPPVLGYDASSTVGERTGIGKAAAELLSAIAEELPEGWTIRALVNSGRHPVPARDDWTRAPNVEVRHTRVPGRLLLRGWQYPRFPPIELLLGRVDLHHSPASYITPALGARGVISVFDLFFLRHPEHRDPFGGTYFARTFPRGLERMDRVITCSRFTRDELIKIYEVSPERIAVVPLGVDRDFFDDEPRPTDRSLLDPWTEGRPYLLCVGAIGPRKNLIGLLEAYAEARRGLADPPLLLMVGRVHDDRSREELDEALDRLALRPWVRFTGYAPAEHLPVLYRHARALVIPSFNEGFGLPVLEAMACGCPVLAAKRGSLPEVAGEAAIMLDIASTSRVAEALARISRDEDLRDRFREAGLERVKSYSWRSSARATIEVYRDLLEETGFWKAEAIREAGRSTAAR